MEMNLHVNVNVNVNVNTIIHDTVQSLDAVF